MSEYFPTDRPSAPAQQREGVPDRPILSATGHAARPDSGDPTDRLSPAPLAAAWLGRTPRPTDPLRSRFGTQSLLSTSLRLTVVERPSGSYIINALNYQHSNTDGHQYHHPQSRQKSHGTPRHGLGRHNSNESATPRQGRAPKGNGKNDRSTEREAKRKEGAQHVEKRKEGAPRAGVGRQGATAAAPQGHPGALARREKRPCAMHIRYVVVHSQS